MVTKLQELDWKKSWVVTVREKEEQRTGKQNNYIWGVLYPSIGSYCGYTVDEIHLICGWKFLRKTLVVHNEESAEVIRSTTDLSIQEMNNYIEQIELYFGSLGWALDDKD